MSSVYPFRTPEEHEQAVAARAGASRSTFQPNHGHLIPCASCHQYFRTTDWPPALCPGCRKGAV